MIYYENMQYVRAMNSHKSESVRLALLKI